VAVLQFLAIVPLLRVIAPCHGTNRAHTELLKPKRGGYIPGQLDKGCYPSRVRSERIESLHSITYWSLRIWATRRDDLVAMVIAALYEHLGGNKTEA